MKSLLTTTAVLEAGTGVALWVAPSAASSMLLGSPIDSPAGLIMGRLLGSALCSIAAACWFAGDDALGWTASGLVAALLLYNVAAVALLSYASVGLGMSGVGLRPAVVLHSALAVWCVASLRAASRNAGGGPIRIVVPQKSRRDGS
ncbi:MAG: hypothetical protein P4L85_28945 [Paludisphaera borealis]|uniref:hypothetical protein n=1 Tax=Paludisphaera borealis TaxID=1387353 RepID=UPI0028521A5F|nr:hypothetical protein [Paludisphaera borealis]MDR3623395.1 hypothetical protein [Paludisphaera borealis]